MESNIYKTKECPMRHKNGNCFVVGGFCFDSVSNEICSALHKAYEKGFQDGADRMKQAQTDFKLR